MTASVRLPGEATAERAARSRAPRVARATCALLALACVSALATGCGTLRYDRAWEAFRPTAEHDPLEGRWKGSWASDWNGHSGGLRCLLTRRAAGLYEAWFHSTYGGFLSFQYTAELEAVDEAGALHLRGEQDLGSLAGGVYRYDATVEGDHFHATFDAENGDHGVFEMQRVP